MILFRHFLAHTGNGIGQFVHVTPGIFRVDIHELNNIIEPAWGNRLLAFAGQDILNPFRRQDVFFLQDTGLIVKNELDSLVAGAEHRAVDDNTFAWLEIELECHGPSPADRPSGPGFCSGAGG